MSVQKFKFDFWLNNKIDQHYELNEVDLIERFKNWMNTKEKSWLEYYYGEQGIRCFIAEKEGLSSVFDEKQYEGIYDVLMPFYNID